MTEGRLAPFLPWGLVTTHDIWANSELVDAVDGAVLWQTDFAGATDWRLPPDRVIVEFTHELAKRFPYRS